MTSREFGEKGEYLARLFLEEKGYVFIRANFRAEGGEIDLIMQENDEIVFIEVKTRTEQSAKTYGRGAKRIDKEKQEHIKKAARAFLRQEKKLTSSLLPRFDAIELYMEREDIKKIRVLHTPFAFGM